MGILSTLFGTGDVISKGIDLIDSMHTSTEEEIAAKSKARTDLLTAYAPFKIAQRVIAFSFTAVFIFIMVNGVVGSLYGWVDIEAVEKAKDFANQMWLGEIMLTIIAFYFGGGAFEGVMEKKKK